MINLTFIVLFASASFLFYGISCLTSTLLVKEFERYGLPKFRIFTGISQLCGSAGLVMGLFYHWLGILAAAGLTMLMFAGLITRIRIKDNLLRSFPSFFFMLLNAYITSAFYVLIEAKEVG